MIYTPGSSGRAIACRLSSASLGFLSGRGFIARLLGRTRPHRKRGCRRQPRFARTSRLWENKPPVLFREAGFDQGHQAVHGFRLIIAVGDDADVVPPTMPRDSTPSKLFALTRRSSFHPDGRFILVGLLDEEGSRAGMEANLILDQNVFLHT